jgi:glycine cleavage system H lipoate-binding protein
MVVLFVVVTFAAFIALDYLLNREKYAVEAEQAERPPVRASARPFEPVFVNGVMMLPTLRYHPGHAWANTEGAATARVGIDDFAARIVAPVSQIDLPPVGRWIRQGEKAFSVHQEGRTAEIMSPVEGEIVQVNTTLRESPQLLRDDPYGVGWVMVVHSPDLSTTIRNLLSGSLAQRWMEDAVERLYRFFAPAVPAMAQDAGPLQPGLGADLDANRWRALVKEFLLN